MTKTSVFVFLCLIVTVYTAAPGRILSAQAKDLIKTSDENGNVSREIYFNKCLKYKNFILHYKIMPTWYLENVWISFYYITIIVQARITVEVSNMPPAWQVEAADALRTAYELQSTPQGRMEFFSQLFYTYEPSYYWNVVLNYDHLYFITNYYIRLRTDTNDIVFLFSGTDTSISNPKDENINVATKEKAVV